jgi:hypothetical protein
VNEQRGGQAEYRAQFDAAVTFANGGGLRAEGFRVDVPGPDVTSEEVAVLFVASLGLLMTERAELANLSVFAEPHKGTRGGPSDRRAVAGQAGPDSAPRRIVDLSHPIRHGMLTFPGLPGPEIGSYLTREQSRSRYAPGTEFEISQITMVGNTGTYPGSASCPRPASCSARRPCRWKPSPPSPSARTPACPFSPVTV